MRLGLPTSLPILAHGQPDAGFSTHRVTSPFALRDDGFHAGLDIGNHREGDLLVAPARGTVIAAGLLRRPWSDPTTRFVTGNFGGLMVIIEHAPQVVSLFAHLRMKTVAEGQDVAAGQKIGEIGDTGSAIGQAHLHFGVQVPKRMVPSGLTTHSAAPAFPRGQVWIDPWPLISGRADLMEDSDMTPVILRPVREEWFTRTAPPTTLFLGGPGLGTRKEFSGVNRITTIAETADNGWRLCLINNELVWVPRAELQPIAGTRQPRTGFGLSLAPPT